MARIQVRVEWLKTRVALLSLLLAAGASADEVVKTYEDAAFDATVSKILVVGVHADRNVRRQFENSVLRALRAAGVSGEASLYSRSSSRELTADTVVAAAQSIEADGVLVTRAVDVRTQNPDATTTFTEYFRAYASSEDPLPAMTTHTVRVRTDLYVVAGQTRIWAVESTALDKQNLFGVIDGISKALVAQLRADGLIGSRREDAR